MTLYVNYLIANYIFIKISINLMSEEVREEAAILPYIMWNFPMHKNIYHLSSE